MIRHVSPHCSKPRRAAGAVADRIQARRAPRRRRIRAVRLRSSCAAGACWRHVALDSRDGAIRQPLSAVAAMVFRSSRRAGVPIGWTARMVSSYARHADRQRYLCIVCLFYLWVQNHGHFFGG